MQDQDTRSRRVVQLRPDQLDFLQRGAALTSTLHGFETEMLASEENLLGLMALNRELVGQAEAFDDSERVVLDMDSTESPVHGQQEGSAYNGHFESVCYEPVRVFKILLARPQYIVVLRNAEYYI